MNQIAVSTFNAQYAGCRGHSSSSCWASDSGSSCRGVHIASPSSVNCLRFAPKVPWYRIFHFCGPVLRRLSPHSLQCDRAAPFVRPLLVLRKPDDVAPIELSTLVGYFAGFYIWAFCNRPVCPATNLRRIFTFASEHTSDLPPILRSFSLASLICLLCPRGRDLRFSCRTLSTVLICWSFASIRLPFRSLWPSLVSQPSMAPKRSRCIWLQCFPAFRYPATCASTAHSGHLLSTLHHISLIASSISSIKVFFAIISSAYRRISLGTRATIWLATDKILRLQKINSCLQEYTKNETICEIIHSFWNWNQYK